MALEGLKTIGGNMPTKEELKMMQNMTLYGKVMMTKVRIREWVRHWGEDNVYVSFSGGKDSTVLLHLVREEFPNVPAVFVNTGLEYPEIQAFAKSFDNVKTVYPVMSFKDVITRYGYPMISKEVSSAVCEVRNPNYAGTSKLKMLNGEKVLGDGRKSPYNCEKYKPLLYTDFVVSDRCCRVMKKAPVKQYERKNAMHPIMGQMAEESRLRTQKWLENGCNGFDMKRPVSNPMSFWLEQDVLQYIKEHNIEICSVYGDIQPKGGQLALDGMECELCTSGCKRTGCIFCGYGCHLEKGETRFQRLKRTHPKQYDYCIGGGAYDPEDGLWKPDKNGLGMAHVFDELNKLYGKDFIRYK
jgi:3'-phosphoadenosine 5'-phosphosulfate sulfotransferase (PAPS reductase)/FAD synthetase